jgi:hypothetical protein
MKKFLTLLLALVMALSIVGCGKTEDQTDDKDTPDEGGDAAVTVMTHAEFDAAAVDSPVTVETYIQAAQGWWEKDGVGVATFYTQADDGAYFLYNMPCSKEDYGSLLVEGAKIRVSGYKAEWSGEVEIIDATWEVLDGNTKTYEALDVTSLLGSDELIQHQNEKVSFKGMTVAASNDAGAPFLYNWDGSGSEGDDLYFNVSLNDTIYTFVVESYLCGPGTDVYEAVKGLNVGDVVDMEGFLYWYNGANPHITSVVKAAA